MFGRTQKTGGRARPCPHVAVVDSIFYTQWKCRKCGDFGCGKGTTREEADGDADVQLENHALVCSQETEG